MEKITKENLQGLIKEYLEWYQQSDQDAVRNQYAEFQNKEYWLNLSEDEVKNLLFEFYKNGGGIQTIDNRLDKSTYEKLNKFKTEIKSNIIQIFDNEFITKELFTKVKFPKIAALTILLQRISPTKYPILNQKSYDGIKSLGYLINKAKYVPLTYNFYLKFKASVDDLKKDILEIITDNNIYDLNYFQIDKLFEYLIGMKKGLDWLNESQKSENEKTIISINPSSDNNFGHQDANPYSGPLNQILYGPPGTGKTYNSIDKAVEISVPERYIKDDHKNNKFVFDELRKSGQIKFVTFHQNYSYEDFMIGIRPDIESESLRFVPYEGIFYQIAKDAKQNYIASSNKHSNERSFQEVFSEIVKPLEIGKKIEVQMASGVFYTITEVSDYLISFDKPNGASHHTLSIKTLEKIVEGLRESTTGLAPYYNPLAIMIKAEKQKNIKTSNEKKENFVLIIDEINRANISKVFGELITLLEDDKRLGEENELTVTLPNGENFVVPPNLYIIGTMNTADKSIALIDIALRRRFEFIGYYPKYDEFPKENNGYNQEAIALLQKINENIYEKKNSADYLIGHAYFMKNQPIQSVLKNKVVPLLMEYFSGKTDIVKDIFEKTGWNVSYDTKNYTWDINKE